MEIARLEDAEVELTPAVAGIFHPLKKLGDPLRFVLKLCCNFWEKLLHKLQVVAPWTSQ